MPKETETEERLIKKDNVPEIIGSENFEKLMEDLIVTDPVDYLKKTLEQAKGEGQKEQARWLLLRAQSEVFKEHMGVIAEYLTKEYGINLKGYKNPLNILTILNYISDQLRNKTRTELWKSDKSELIPEYTNVVI